MESIDKITITEVKDKHRQNETKFTCLIFELQNEENNINLNILKINLVNHEDYLLFYINTLHVESFFFSFIFYFFYFDYGL